MSTETKRPDYLVEKEKQRIIARCPLGQIERANQILQSIQDSQERQKKAQHLSNSLIYLPYYTSSMLDHPYPFSVHLSQRDIISLIPPGCVFLEANKDYLGGMGDEGRRYHMVRREANPPDLIDYFSSDEARRQLSLFASFLFDKDESEISLFLGDKDIKTNLEKYLSPINPLKSGPLISLADENGTLSVSVAYLKMGIPLGEIESFVIDASKPKPEEVKRWLLTIEDEARKEYMRRLQEEYDRFYHSCPKEKQGPPPLNDAEVTLIKQIDFSNKDILEIGPGLGILAMRLQEIARSVDVVEFSEEARKFLREGLHGHIYPDCDQTRDFRNKDWQKKYDFIIAEGVIEEAYDPAATLEDWAGFLKKDGSLLITWPKDNNSLLPLIEEARLVVREQISTDGCPYSFYRLSWPEPTIRQTDYPVKIWGLG